MKRNISLLTLFVLIPVYMFVLINTINAQYFVPKQPQIYGDMYLTTPEEMIERFNLKLPVNVQNHIDTLNIDFVPVEVTIYDGSPYVRVSYVSKEDYVIIKNGLSFTSYIAKAEAMFIKKTEKSHYILVAYEAKKKRENEWDIVYRVALDPKREEI